MFIYTFIYIYIDRYICIHIFIYIYTYIYIYTSGVSIAADSPSIGGFRADGLTVYTLTSPSVLATPKYRNMCLHKYIYVYIHICIHDIIIYVYIYIYIYIYICIHDINKHICIFINHLYIHACI
jgi:hypothetical protein